MICVLYYATAWMKYRGHNSLHYPSRNYTLQSPASCSDSQTRLMGHFRGGILIFGFLYFHRWLLRLLVARMVCGIGFEPLKDSIYESTYNFPPFLIMPFQKGDFLLKTANTHTLCVGGGLLYILCTSINVAEYWEGKKERLQLLFWVKW